MYPCQIPPQSSLLLRRNSFEARNGKALGVLIFRGSYGNSRPIVNGDIRPPPTEDHFPVYCDSYDTGDMYGERTANRTMGETTVVEAGGCIPIPRGSEGGGKVNIVFYGD